MATSLPRKKLRVVCISDSHNATPYIPSGDLLIHAGDLTNCGGHSELLKALKWLAGQPHEHKLIIAGNHDGVTLDSAAPYSSRLPEGEAENARSLIESYPGLTYLLHEPYTFRFRDGRKVRVFASPYTPLLSEDFAGFTYPSSPDTVLWDEIPSDTEILVTHGPPRTHLDRDPRALPPQRYRGCEMLRQRVSVVKPVVHVFGHVHAGRGVERVKWDLGARHVQFKEAVVERVEDRFPERSRKGFVVRAGEGGRETVMVNAAVMKGRWKDGRHDGGLGKAVAVEFMVTVE
jgi:hypothetical protein